MGCAFDMYSTSINDRSYVVVLFILAWFIPLIVISVSYLGIVYRIRMSSGRFKGFSENKANVDSIERGTKLSRSVKSDASTHLAQKVFCIVHQ